MKISFVIPAYNEENYLGKCLESLRKRIAETKIEAEIIVVNNASTDQTAAVARRFGAKVIDEPVKGVGKARQTGFLTSVGELIANVDADTIMPPGWIETVLEFFQNNSELAAVSGPHIFYDAPPVTGFLAWIFSHLAYLAYLQYRIFRLGPVLQGGNFVVRREALNRAGGFDTSFSFYGEDSSAARRFAAVGEVMYSLRLRIFASARRLEAEGNIVSGIRYILNYLWVNLVGRPFSLAAKDIRLR